MRAPIYQVDAFTSTRFAGNPAAVILLTKFLPDATLQAIAAENNLAETAYLVPENDEYRLRWFTPETEVPLCGHATLASAAVVMERVDRNRAQVVFHSASGPLTVTKNGAGYLMDFPTRPSGPVPAPTGLAKAIGVAPLEVTENDFNYLALLTDETTLRAVVPDGTALIRIGKPGLIITAPSSDPRYDFVSRYFAPMKGILEDPVTGSAHCMLAPFWAPRLGKTDFAAWQASARGGKVICRLRGDRTELEGECVFYLEGQVEI
ncbi:MAG TPA: PhzF family phenazine biosynthesis protein [Acidobacteriaceae bacterium]|nr:PhzF family phenazine biosynthesis protein [Acidobacteriaceae bacterium]